MDNAETLGIIDGDNSAKVMGLLHGVLLFLANGRRGEERPLHYLISFLAFIIQTHGVPFDDQDICSFT